MRSRTKYLHHQCKKILLINANKSSGSNSKPNKLFENMKSSLKCLFECTLAVYVEFDSVLNLPSREEWILDRFSELRKLVKLYTTKQDQCSIEILLEID